MYSFQLTQAQCPHCRQQLQKVFVSGRQYVVVDGLITGKNAQTPLVLDDAEPTITCAKCRKAVKAKAQKTIVLEEPGPIIMLPLAQLKPAILNDKIYKPVEPDDPSIFALAMAIMESRELEPLVITLDDVIISGHRRRMALMIAGVKIVPCRRLPIYSTDPDFPAKLVAYNQAQRDKTTAERFREQLVLADPEDSLDNVTTDRIEKSEIEVETIEPPEPKPPPKVT